MKSRAPDVLRKGCLLRIAADALHAGAEIYALAFLDLRFEDGHVERWLAGGSARRLSAPPEPMAWVMSWAGDAAEEYAFSVMCDVARSYRVDSPRFVDELPCEEIVVEWNAEPRGR